MVGMRWLAIGLLSTLTMDLARPLAFRLGLCGPTPGNLAPRWIAYVVRGRLVHADIASAPQLHGELPTFLVAHYLIGLTLAAFYLMVAGRAAGNFLWAGLYGLATSAFAWLLMFPAMGYGAFGVRFEGTPIRTTAFFHLVFGLALALWWRVFNR